MKRRALFMMFVLLGWGCNAVAEELYFKTKHDIQVFGTFEKVTNGSKRILLLFHQARSNRFEYAPLVQGWHKLGFDTLAIDQRSGGKMWGQTNKTVETLGQSRRYIEALEDLQAALDWAVKKKYETIICVGSSYSAALVFLLAEKNSKVIDGLACFSPGEYLGKKDLVKKAAKNLKLPLFITAASNNQEQANIRLVLSEMKSTKKVSWYRATYGVHGASTLRDDKNSKGAEQNRIRFQDFLKSLY